MQRRNFIKHTATASIAISTATASLFSKKRKFKICFNPGAIGVSADMDQLLDYAIKYGYEAIVANSSQLAEFSDLKTDDFLRKMKLNDISWGAAGLPMDFRKDRKIFVEGLKSLPGHARKLEQFGVSRLGTWIMPTNDTLTYRENYHQHAKRLKQIANILGHHGISFGLEYVGPKTLMAGDQYPFVSSMREAKELIEAIGETNVGFVLDSFHWHCAEETAADLLSLDNSDIVTVDLNDAVAGRTIYEQMDLERELPGNSGVIDHTTGHEL